MAGKDNRIRAFNVYDSGEDERLLAEVRGSINRNDRGAAFEEGGLDSGDDGRG